MLGLLKAGTLYCNCAIVQCIRMKRKQVSGLLIEALKLVQANFSSFSKLLMAALKPSTEKFWEPVNFKAASTTALTDLRI